MSSKEKKSPSIADRINYFYIKNIKKWMFCPACKDGKMSFVKKRLRGYAKIVDIVSLKSIFYMIVFSVFVTNATPT